MPLTDETTINMPISSLKNILLAYRSQAKSIRSLPIGNRSPLLRLHDGAWRHVGSGSESCQREARLMLERILMGADAVGVGRRAWACSIVSGRLGRRMLIRAETHCDSFSPVDLDAAQPLRYTSRTRPGGGTADTSVSKTDAERCVGSNPTPGTILFWKSPNSERHSNLYYSQGIRTVRSDAVKKTCRWHDFRQPPGDACAEGRERQTDLP